MDATRVLIARLDKLAECLVTCTLCFCDSSVGCNEGDNGGGRGGGTRGRVVNFSGEKRGGGGNGGGTKRTKDESGDLGGTFGEKAGDDNDNLLLGRTIGGDMETELGESEGDTLEP